MEKTKFQIFVKIIIHSEYSTWKKTADIELNFGQNFVTLQKYIYYACTLK
jgi:hypothetical protein